MSETDAHVAGRGDRDLAARTAVWWVLACAALAIAVRCAALHLYQPDKTPWADESQYVNLAASLADGRGYVLPEGNLWPGRPTIIRAPGWPLMLAGAFAVVPEAWRWETARALTVALDCANVVLIYFLARGLTAGRRASLAAAALYAANPAMIAMSAMVASEVTGVLLVLVFLNHLIRGRDPSVGRLMVSGLLLGIAILVRPNFVVVAGFVAAGIVWLGRSRPLRALAVATAFGLAAVLPITPWLVRNALVFGHFPILGSGGGETLRGGNNDLAAEPGGTFEGYIVQPGQFPGERPLAELARTMNEYEADRYLFAQGLRWVKENAGRMPRLMLMKLKRAYVPVSRSRRYEVVAANAYRWVVDVAALSGLIVAWRRGMRLAPLAVIGLGAVIGGHVLVAAVFCGVNRYVLPSEILLVLPAGYMLAQVTAIASRR